MVLPQENSHIPQCTTAQRC